MTIDYVFQRVKMSWTVAFSDLAYVKSVDQELDYFGRKLRVQIRADVWGSHKKTVTLDAPLNSWEHLKEDYAPAWVLKCWPVKKQKYKFEAQLLFPELARDELPRGHETLTIRSLDVQYAFSGLK